MMAQLIFNQSELKKVIVKKDGETHLKAKRFRFGISCAEVIPKALKSHQQTTKSRVVLVYVKDGEAHLKAKRFRFGVSCAEVIPKAHWCASSGELKRKLRRS